MKKFLTSDKIYISKSKIPNAGRGVYAMRNIKKDEIIERCPIIEVSKHDTSNLRESILVTYFFYFGKNKERLMLALGFGSIYNHAHRANATYKIKHTENTIDFIAVKDIKKDGEITINYKNGNPKNKSPLWFEVVPSAK
jgi:SET domain-containing protein